MDDWEIFYRETDARKMPWFFERLDPDLREALEEFGIMGGRFLDIGTGPGTQAVALSKKGFGVTGTDISETAVRKASKLSKSVRFLQDNVLYTKLRERFDFVFDRGTFHTIPLEERRNYVSTVASLLHEGGMLFLKTFSVKEPPGKRPHRFSPKDIKGIFGKRFEILSIKDTVYQGKSDPPPKALFAVLKLMGGKA